MWRRNNGLSHLFLMSPDHPQVIALFAPLARARHEVVAFAFFDADGRLLGLRHCPSADFFSIEVPLRKAAADALVLDARQVVMAHNHPSNDPEPSREDIAATRRISLALGALGIRLVDHLVLARDGAVSLRARGAL